MSEACPCCCLLPPSSSGPEVKLSISSIYRCGAFKHLCTHSSKNVITASSSFVSDVPSGASAPGVRLIEGRQDIQKYTSEESCAKRMEDERTWLRREEIAVRMEGVAVMVYDLRRVERWVREPGMYGVSGCEKKMNENSC